MAEIAYRSQVRVERIKGSLRHAFLPEEPQPVKFGTHGAVAKHYGAQPAAYEPPPDYGDEPEPDDAPAPDDGMSGRDLLMKEFGASVLSEDQRTFTQLGQGTECGSDRM